MTGPSPREKRVLAIDPTTKGFGFAVLEGPKRLIDWGVVQVRGDDRHAACLKRIDGLLRRYVPEVVVVEDCARPGSRRRARARALIDEIVGLAAQRKTRTRRVSLKQVLKAFREVGVVTKYQIAGAIATLFSELGPRLPPPRRPWMSEDARMSIFDAAALGLTYFRRREGHLD